MSFQDNKPDTTTIRMMAIFGLLIGIAIVMVNEGKKFKKDRNNSVVVTEGEVSK